MTPSLCEVGDVIKRSITETLKRRKSRTNDGVAVETETISRLPSTKLVSVSPSEPKEMRAEEEACVLRSKKRKFIAAELHQAEEEGRITRSRVKTEKSNSHRRRFDSEISPSTEPHHLSVKQHTKPQQSEAKQREKEALSRPTTRSQPSPETTATSSPIRYRPSSGAEKEFSMQQAERQTFIATESNQVEEEGRITRSRVKTEKANSHQNHLDSEISRSAKPLMSLKHHTKPQQSETTHREEEALSKPTTRSQPSPETTAAYPIRYRPSLGLEKESSMLQTENLKCITTEPNQAEDEGRRTRNRVKSEKTKNQQRHLDSEISRSAKPLMSLKQHTKPQQHEMTQREKEALSRPTTRSQPSPKTTAASPIRHRPPLGGEKELSMLQAERQMFIATESNQVEEEGRMTRSRLKTEKANIHQNHRDSEISRSAEPHHLSVKQQTKNQQHEPKQIEKEALSRPTTRSQPSPEMTATSTSPIRYRLSVGQWKGPATTAHVDRQHAYQSLLLRDMDVSHGAEDNSMENGQLYYALKALDNIPDDNIVYLLSATELLDDYEDLTNQNTLVEKIPFGGTIESALSAIERKLKQLEQYDFIEDMDIEEEMREYKRSLKSLAALRESECLVRFREMEQDRENHMRQQSSGVQAAETPMQIEVSELCDRKIWWVGEKEWLNGSERSCMFGVKCAICLRKKKRKLSANSSARVSLKMPRVSIFNPQYPEEVENKPEDSKPDEVRRYNIRSTEMQKKVGITRLKLQRLHASLSFVDRFNRTGKQFLPK